MTKHTPAPWKIINHKDKYGSHGTKIISDYNIEQPIAHIYSYETEKANARLIASAPELLEELKSLTEWTEKTFRALESAEWVNQDRLYHSIPKNIAERALEAARTAIEKAEA